MSQERTISAKLHDDYWVSIQRRSDLVATTKENEEFYNGEQWPEGNPSNMPRITLNVVKMAVDTVASKINGTPIYLLYSSTDGSDMEPLRRFDDFVCAQMDHDTFSWRSAVNGQVNGTEITYLRWDDNAEHDGGFYKGGLKEEHISPLCFAVADFMNDDLQSQAWVMFWRDAQYGQLESILKEEGFKKQVEKDRIEALREEAKRDKRNDDLDPNKDVNPSAMIRVYVRFFRVGGEVFYTYETDHVELLKAPRPLSSKVTSEAVAEIQAKYEEAKSKGGSVEPYEDFFRDYPIDYENTSIEMHLRENSLKEHRMVKERFGLYPFAVYRPSGISSRFLGSSMAHSMITSQMAVNWDLSMVCKSAENNAYNKIIVKEDALQGQRITNEPGQVLVDHTPNPNGWGIKFAESQPLPNDVTNFASFMVNQTIRVYAGGDVMNGQITDQNISGYAVQQMIKQANTPLEQVQKVFWKYQKDLARIRLLFYKHYVSETCYAYDYDDASYAEEEQSRMAIMSASYSPDYGKPGFMGNMYGEDGEMLTPNDIRARFSKPTPRHRAMEFDGRKMWGVDYDIRVDAIQGLTDSELAETQAYQTLVQNMQNMSPEQIEFDLKANPSYTPAFRAKASKIWKGIMSSAIVQLRQQNAQLQAELEEEKQRSAIQQQANQDLQAEFTSKINSANRINRYQVQANDELQRRLSEMQAGKAGLGVSEGEAKSNAARSISGSKIDVSQN